MFFSNFGVAYTSRIIDVPASTGYGEPIQRLFKLKDGEKVVAAMSLDPRAIGNITPKKEGAEAPVHAVAVSSDGYALQVRRSTGWSSRAPARAAATHGRPKRRRS